MILRPTRSTRTDTPFPTRRSSDLRRHRVLPPPAYRGGKLTTSSLPDPATPLSRESAAQAFADILDARASDDAIADFLIHLSQRGETSIEIAEAALALRERVPPINAMPGAIDVCGTGGAGQDRKRTRLNTRHYSAHRMAYAPC